MQAEVIYSRCQKNVSLIYEMTFQLHKFIPLVLFYQLAAMIDKPEISTRI